MPFLVSAPPDAWHAPARRARRKHAKVDIGIRFAQVIRHAEIRVPAGAPISQSSARTADPTTPCVGDVSPLWRDPHGAHRVLERLRGAARRACHALLAEWVRRAQSRGAAVARGPTRRLIRLSSPTGANPPRPPVMPVRGASTPTHRDRLEPPKAHGTRSRRSTNVPPLQRVASTRGSLGHAFYDRRDDAVTLEDIDV